MKKRRGRSTWSAWAKRCQNVLGLLLVLMQLGGQVKDVIPHRRGKLIVENVSESVKTSISVSATRITTQKAERIVVGAVAKVTVHRKGETR